MRRNRFITVGAVAIAMTATMIVGSGVSTAAPARPQGSIVVSAAASLTDVLPVIAAGFEKRYPGTSVRFNFGGSPQLVEQVNAGAPVDVLAT